MLCVTLPNITGKLAVETRQAAALALFMHPGSIVLPQGTQNLQVHRHMGDRLYGRVRPYKR